MKFRPVTKLDKRSKPTSKNLTMTSCEVKSNCEVIVIFLVYGIFGEIRKPDFGRIVCKTYIFINNSLLSYKKLNTELKNIKYSAHTITLSKGTIFALVLKGVFLKTTCACIYVPNLKFLA